MDYINRLKIKTSDTQEMKLVFTAQSKHFFYCRDVVCEYVMKQGYLPINPFRVFDYFLSDRVDRDLVRRGNNQLIRTCDELWVFGNIADGVLFEIVSAIEQKKPVKFFTIGAELKEIKEISVDEITFEPQVHAAQIKKQDIIDFIKTGEVKENEDALSGQLSIFDLPQNEIKRHDENEYDIAVIGLGPSGMMAFNHICDSTLSVIGIDMGKNPYDRSQEPKDIACGFGGAGLFSDGKLSFYPAGSRLWSGLPQNDIHTAYDTVLEDLKNVGCEIPEWQQEWETEYKGINGNNHKIYESIYFSREQSDSLVRGIYDRRNGDLLLNTRVKCIRRGVRGYLIETADADKPIIHAKKLVMATGKLGSAVLKNVDETVAFKKRYEGGVRIETASENFIPIDYAQKDYKIIEKLDNSEIRSFCCCKDGVVLKSCYKDINEVDTIISYNGSVCEQITGRSNIGITIRTEDEDSVFVKEFTNAIRTNLPKEFSLREVDEMHKKNTFIIGADSDLIIRDFINRIIRSDADEYNTVIYWPEVEYFGRYPVFDWDSLKIPNTDIWVIGDATGEFRGLIPAMVSGVFAANMLKQEM